MQPYSDSRQSRDDAVLIAPGASAVRFALMLPKLSTNASTTLRASTSFGRNVIVLAFGLHHDGRRTVDREPEHVAPNAHLHRDAERAVRGDTKRTVAHTRDLPTIDASLLRELTDRQLRIDLAVGGALGLLRLRRLAASHGNEDSEQRQRSDTNDLRAD
ncbi:MAG: hypothetical protein QM811_09295 [Pirellulales bacterium]